MSDEEIRIAIATQLGWKWDDQTVYAPPDSSRWARVGFNGGDELFRVLPDYPNDLNACHEAAETLRKNQFHFVQYPGELFFVVTGRKWDGDMGYFMFNYAQASARQISEAVLRTIGKWKP